MCHAWKAMVLCIAVCICAAHDASAATYNILAFVMPDAFDPTFDPLVQGVDYTVANQDFGPSSNPAVTGPAGYYEVQLWLGASDFASGQRGVGSIEFGANYTGGTNPTGFGWLFFNPAVDTDGTISGGSSPMWSANSDSGIEFGNSVLISQAVIPSPGTDDPRPYWGQPNPVNTAAGDYTVAPWSPITLLGSLLVFFDGSIGTFEPVLTNTAYAQSSDGTLVSDTNTSTKMTALVGFNIPEPASASLLVFAACGLAIHRRHS